MTTLGLHHRILACLLAVLIYALLATLLAAAPESRVLLASPDHPRTFWTNPFDQVDHYVQWNSSAGRLEGYVAYGDPSRANWWNPVLYDSFKVQFPGVHLDAKEGRLFVLDAHRRQITIGHLQPGVFGPRVELEKNVDLDTHRKNGHLYAALVTAPN